MDKKTSQFGSKQKVAMIYCRVSTEDQRDNGTSLETQTAECLAYASQQGWKVLRVVNEEFSGKKLYDRALLVGCLKGIQQGKADILLCYHADRLSRHQTHSLIIFDDLCDVGAELWFVRHGKIEDSPMGRAMLSLYATGAAMEWDNTRERTMRGKRARVESGKIHRAGCELYGYRRDKELGVRRIYEPEAVIVRQIFDWCAKEGKGTRSIAFRLNRQEVPSPSFGKKNYKDGRKAQWGKSQVMRILREPAYKGVTIAWRYKNQGCHKMVAIRPESEHIRMPDGTTPPIVTPELWQAAQDSIANNRGETKRNENVKHQFLLRGLISCSVCNRRMYASIENGRLPIYRCSSRHTVGHCGGKRVPAQKGEDWAWGIVRGIINDPDIVATELRRLEEEDFTPQLTAQLEATKREIERIERGQQKLIRRFRDVEDESLSELLEREIKQAEKEKAQVKTTLTDIESRLASKQNLISALKSLEDFCEQVRTRLESFSFEDKRLALRALNVQIYANGKDWGNWRFNGNLPDVGLLESHSEVTGLPIESFNNVGEVALTC